MSMHSSLCKVAVASVELGSFFAGGGGLWVVRLSSAAGRRDEGRIYLEGFPLSPNPFSSITSRLQGIEGLLVKEILYLLGFRTASVPLYVYDKYMVVSLKGDPI